MISIRQQIQFSRIKVVSLHFLILFVATGILGCSKQGDANSSSDAGKKKQRVSVAKAVEEKVTDFAEFVGRTQADKEVDIRSRVSGFLQKKHFDDGQFVKKGDPLFDIEPDQYQAIYYQSLARIKIAKAEVDLAEKTEARSAALLEKNAVSVQEHQENQAKVATAKAQLVAAEADAARTELDVDYTKIISPIDGRVDASVFDEGNYVTGGIIGGTVLTTVVTISPMKALANVDENVILRFMRRQRELGGAEFKQVNRAEDLKVPCYLQLSDEDDFPHEGLVEYVQVQVDKSTGTSKLRAVFDNKNGLLKPGMFVRLRVPVTDPYSTVLVPDRSIGTDQATQFVYVVDDKNVVSQRQVVTGDRKGSLRVIKSGVKAGEVVITKGLQLVQPGMTIDPEFDSKESAPKTETDPEAKSNQKKIQTDSGGNPNEGSSQR